MPRTATKESVRKIEQKGDGREPVRKKNKFNREIPVAVLGATGLVGQQFVRMLDGHPFFRLVTVSGSAGSRGKSYADAAAWSAGRCLPGTAAGLKMVEAEAKELLAAGVRVVFSALPGEAASLEAELRDLGFFVFSNNSRHRHDPDVPVLVPEVNPASLELLGRQKLRYGGFISTGSNCTTAGLVMVLKPLLELDLKAYSLTTFQAVSGAGRKGLPAFGIMGNVIPRIAGEEEKIIRESRKILSDESSKKKTEFNIPGIVTCTRVPVAEGHLQSLVLEFPAEVAPDEVISRLVSFRARPQEMKLPSAPEKPLLVSPLQDRPQPVLDAWAGTPERAAGMAVTIGRVRAADNRLALFLLVHNTVRGAAGNCLLAAELAAGAGLLEDAGRN